MQQAEINFLFKFTFSFFNLTILKTMWNPQLRYNRSLFSTGPTPWSFYIGQHFTSSMEQYKEPLV